MRVYRSGHGARVLMMLAMAVLAVATIAYGLGALEDWGRALAVGLTAGLLLTSSWILVWVLRQNVSARARRRSYDSLTDLPNRSSFVERVDRALSRAVGGSRSIAVLLVDLDDFEEINHTLGQWIMREACHQTRIWREEHPSDAPLMLSVNVSARQFRQPNLAEEILSTLDGSDLDPRHLILEITEGVMVHHVAAAAALRELKSSGIRLPMDDFGTGYSSLSSVKRLPVSIIKIDRSYGSGLASAAEDTAIVHATAAFAKALGLGLIAEGIETAEQLVRLREVGCELGQGHHFAKPLPSEEVLAFLDAHSSTMIGSGWEDLEERHDLSNRFAVQVAYPTGPRRIRNYHPSASEGG